MVAIQNIFVGLVFFATAFCGFFLLKATSTDIGLLFICAGISKRSHRFVQAVVPKRTVNDLLKRLYQRKQLLLCSSGCTKENSYCFVQAVVPKRPTTELFRRLYQREQLLICWSSCTKENSVPKSKENSNCRSVQAVPYLCIARTVVFFKSSALKSYSLSLWCDLRGWLGLKSGYLSVHLFCLLAAQSCAVNTSVDWMHLLMCQQYQHRQVIDLSPHSVLTDEL